MDTLSIIATATNIADVCFRIAQALNRLREKFKSASLTISAIYLETTTIHMWLTQLQNIFADDASIYKTHFQTQNHLATAFDTTLIGCMMLFSGLETEINKLGDLAGAHFGSITWKAKMRFVWKEDTMVSLQHQLRGHVNALSFLVQGLQMESMADIRRLMRKNKKVLDKVARDTNHLRLRYPANSVPRSIFAASTTTESVAENEGSSIGSTNLPFEHHLLNSEVYRWTLHNTQSEVNSLSVAVSNTPEQDLNNYPIESQQPTMKPLETVDQHSQLPVVFTNKQIKKPDTNSLVSIDVGEIVELSPTTTRDQRTCSIDPVALNPPQQPCSLLQHSPTSHEDSFEPLLDWELHFRLQNRDLTDYRRDRVAFQNHQWNILQKAWTLNTHLDVVNTLYSAQILAGWPRHGESPPHAVQKVFQNLLEIKALHEQFLLNPLLAMWQTGGPWTSFDPQPFLQFISKASRIYEAFSRSYLWTVMYVQTQQESSERLAAILANSRRRRSSSVLNWTTLLDAPLRELQDICASLTKMEAHVLHEGEKKEITEATVAFRQLISTYNTRLSESTSEVECKHVEQEFNVTLQPHTSGILFRQHLPVRLSSPTKRSSLGPWKYCDVVLFKDRLLVARARTVRPEARSLRHNDGARRNREANSIETVEDLKFDSFEHALASSRLVKPIKAGMFAAGEVPRDTELWPVSLVVESPPGHDTSRQNKSKIGWQIILGVKNEQDRREWEVRLLLCDGVWS